MFTCKITCFFRCFDIFCTFHSVSGESASWAEAEQTNGFQHSVAATWAIKIEIKNRGGACYIPMKQTVIVYTAR